MTDISNQGVIEPDAVAPQAEAHTERESEKEYNFKAMREQMASMKNQNDMLQRQLEDYQASLRQQQPQPKEVVQDDDDLLTKGEVKKLLNQKEAQLSSAIAELQLRTKFQDFDSVVQKEHFEDLTKQYGVEFAEAVISSKNPNLLAYVIGKNTDAYRKKSSAKQQHADAQRIMANAQKPGSVNQATSGSGALSGADYYMNLSKADFEAKVRAIKKG